LILSRESMLGTVTADAVLSSSEPAWEVATQRAAGGNGSP